MTTETINTLDDLLSPDSPDEAATALFTELAAAGFPTTSWADDSVPVVLVQTEAKALSEQANLARDLAAGGLLALSTDEWLDLLAASAYGLTRYGSTFATVRVRLSCAMGLGPVNVAAYAYTIRRGDGLRWTSQNAGVVVIPNGGSLVVDFKAESPGAAYGALLGQAISLITPVPGVTAAFEDAGSGSPVVTAGADTEKNTNFAARCAGRWDTIGVQKTAVAYGNLCVNAGVVSVARLVVDDANPRGPGTVDLWVAGSVGPIGAGDLAIIDAYLQERKSPSTDLQVDNAAQITVEVLATIRIEAGASNVIAEATEALTTLINAVPIGGTLYRDEVIEALVSPSGARSTATLTIKRAGVVVAGDVSLGPSEVAVVTAPTITTVSV
jgi:hypothetical protein